MSEFYSGFRDTYHDDLVALIDVGEELPLVRKPTVIVSGVPSLGNFNCEYLDQTEEELDPATPEDNAGRVAITRGRVACHLLDANATIPLLTAAFLAEYPDADVTAPLTREQGAYVGALGATIKNLVHGSHHAYAKFEFVSPQTDQHLAVTNIRIDNETAAPIARQIEITTGDSYIEKTLTISELPTSFDGETELSVRQSIFPVRNEVFIEAEELFTRTSFLEGLTVLIGLFFTELNGIENVETADLIARYEETEHIDRLRRILDGIRLQAAGAREASKLAGLTPELELPSAAELDDYRDMLSSLRA